MRKRLSTPWDRSVSDRRFAAALPSPIQARESDQQQDGADAHRVFEVVAQSCDEEGEALLAGHGLDQPGMQAEAEGCLQHVDSMEPVMIWIV